MKLYLATDHAGFELKEKVREVYSARGFDVVDCGATAYDAGDDYTVYMHKCAERYRGADESDAQMIVFGGSGTGEAIVMNRYAGIRAVVYNGQSFDIVRFARLHNDANCLSVGARFVSYEDALEAIELFLVTEFEGGRHAQRVQNIEKMR
jgi:ribose 5-phosphate isomerase B